MQIIKVVIFLLIELTFLYSTGAIVTQHFITDNRQLYAYWNSCGPCACDYFYVIAYEQTTRSPGNNNEAQNPVSYLYYYHYRYDYCSLTWGTEWASMQDPLTGLSISNSGRTASLNISGLIDSDGHHIHIDLYWNDIDARGNCNCRYYETVGPVSYRSISRSAYSRTDVSGTITIDNNVYQPSNALGYIYDYGSKSVTLTHL